MNRKHIRARSSFFVEEELHQKPSCSKIREMSLMYTKNRPVRLNVSKVSEEDFSALINIL